MRGWIEFALVALVSVGGLVAWLHNQHAKEAETQRQLLEVRAELQERDHKHHIENIKAKIREQERDIARDNKIRYHYEDQEEAGTLSPDDAKRLKQIRRGLDDKYSELELLNDDLNTLESK